MDNKLTEEIQHNLAVMLGSDDLESVTLGLKLLLTFSYPEKFIEVKVKGMSMFFDTYVRSISRNYINYYMLGINRRLSVNKWVKDNLKILYDLEDYGKPKLEFID